MKTLATFVLTIAVTAAFAGAAGRFLGRSDPGDKVESLRSDARQDRRQIHRLEMEVEELRAADLGSSRGAQEKTDQRSGNTYD